jgi:hypothetical protein
MLTTLHLQQLVKPKLNLHKVAIIRVVASNIQNIKVYIRSGFLPFLILLFTIPSFAQTNISGKTGLIYTPAARYSEDGNLAFGIHFFPGNYGFGTDNSNPGRVLYMNLTVLPRFDVNINNSASATGNLISDIWF